MAFASWGTQIHDWPEVMVFNRSVQLIGQINFPGSAFSVDVSTDGQYVVGGAKAVHANQFGSGGRIELIQLQPSPTPTPTATALPQQRLLPRPRPLRRLRRQFRELLPRHGLVLAQRRARSYHSMRRNALLISVCLA